MECIDDHESLSPLEQATASDESAEDTDEMSAKRFCTTLSNHTPRIATTSAAVAEAYSESSVYMQSGHSQDSLSDSAGVLLCSSDDTVTDVNGHSRVAAVNSAADAEHSAQIADANADVSRRRHPRRKTSTNVAYCYTFHTSVVCLCICLSLCWTHWW